MEVARCGWWQRRFIGMGAYGQHQKTVTMAHLTKSAAERVLHPTRPGGADHRPRYCRVYRRHGNGTGTAGPHGPAWPRQRAAPFGGPAPEASWGGFY